MRTPIPLATTLLTTLAACAGPSARAPADADGGADAVAAQLVHVSFRVLGLQKAASGAT
jgi:hypothetical protein